MRATFSQSNVVIPGRVITHQDPLTGLLQAAGVFLIGQGEMARLKEGGKTILLRGVKIIVRTSGRKARHLARYLVGVSDQGTYHEAFLEVVAGVVSPPTGEMASIIAQVSIGAALGGVEFRCLTLTC